MNNKPEVVIQNHIHIIIQVVLFFFLLIFFVRPKERKIAKDKLVNVYQVDKKTFNKWLYYFCSDLISDFEVYKSRRTVSPAEYQLILSRLGKPSKHPILTKKEIIAEGEGTYNSLRKSIKKYPVLFGLPSYKAYLVLKKFPPNISHRIRMQFG